MRRQPIDDAGTYKVLGVDPGINGALALVGDGYLAVDHLPTMGSGRQRIINAVEISDIIYRWAPDVAVIERVHAMPKQGISSAFRFGQAFGTLEGVIAGRKIPLYYITPQSWKRHYRLPADKEAARMRAIQLYPRIADRLSRKKDSDRAEALLIAAMHFEGQRQ